MKIPMLDLKAQHASIADEVEGALLSVLRGQQLILGPEVKEFEREMASYCGCAEAVACASGSDALLLSLMALGVGPGDEVVTTPYTFFATAGSIVRLGAKPVFVDIDAGSFNMNPDLLDGVFTSRTKAIIPIHLFGQCALMEQIGDVAAAHGVPIIEDAAQAVGAEDRGRRAGTIGQVGCFSFYPSKNLGGGGDGGLMTTNDEEFAERLRMLRSHGAKKKYYHDLVGLNSRLDSLQAAILRVKLRHLKAWTEARRANAVRYRRLFNEAGLVDSGNVTLPVETHEQFHVYNQFVVRARARDRLKAHMAEKGIGTEIYYPVPMHLQPCFAGLGYGEGDLPESERAARESLAIPIYPELGEDAQEYIVDTIAGFYA
jgi:dTDP-4-amino-4,6-dideoxygalactose transaminase